MSASPKLGGTISLAAGYLPMHKLMFLTLAATALALSACGHNVEQRAATGAVAGAVVAGPIGAAVGAGAGVVVSRASDRR